MNQGRIPRLDAATAKAMATEHGLPEFLGDLSVFQIALRNPRVATALNGMLHNLLMKGELDGRLRELIILRIGWATGSVYEWTQHWRVATGHENEAMSGHRRGDRDLRIRTERPSQRAGGRVVTANLGAVGDELVAAVGRFHDRRCAPG